MMTMSAQDAAALRVKPGEIELMHRLVDSLTAGEVDLFQQHEKEWHNTNLCQFMAAGADYRPKPATPKLDPVAIYARWNKETEGQRKMREALARAPKLDEPSK